MLLLTILNRVLLYPGTESRNLVIESTYRTNSEQSKSALREDEVLRQIEQAVIDHRLPPGTKLKEVQLAEVFGVKRGTIRKVLSRLAHSRLVDQMPNRGARVAKPSVKEGRDLFAARRAIERANLETLCRQISRGDIKQLRKMLDQEQKAYLKSDSRQALSLSIDFHRQLAKMANNSVMEEYLSDIIRRTPLVILTHLGSDLENRCRNQEHETIVDAIENGDAKRAVKIMDQHLLHIENQIKHKAEEPHDLAELLLASTN